jgi:hypothetical protein
MKNLYRLGLPVNGMEKGNNFRRPFGAAWVKRFPYPGFRKAAPWAILRRRFAS